MDRQSQDSEKPLDTAPAECHSRKKAAAKQQCPPPEVKGRTCPGQLQLQGVWGWSQQEPKRGILATGGMVEGFRSFP